MNKLLIGLLLGLFFSVSANEEQIGDWYLVNDHSAFTPAVNTNSYAIGIFKQNEIIYFMVLGDFNECLPYSSEGQVTHKTMVFNNDYSIKGMVECRGEGSKTDTWYPSSVSGALVIEALLTGNKYLSSGTIVYSTEGYKDVMQVIK